MRHAVGQLADRPLIAIVRSIYRSRRSGELRLQADGRSQQLYFQGGDLFLPSSDALASAVAEAAPRALARRLAQDWRGWTEGSYEFLEGHEKRAPEWVGPLPTAHVLMEEAVAVAHRTAKLSRPVVMLAQEAVNRAYETTLAEGVRFERRLFHSTFAIEDQSEGMAAFVEKREPRFRNR